MQNYHSKKYANHHEFVKFRLGTTMRRLILSRRVTVVSFFTCSSSCLLMLHEYPIPLLIKRLLGTGQKGGDIWQMHCSVIIITQHFKLFRLTIFFYLYYYFKYTATYDNSLSPNDNKRKR